jgi:hypothetical protein
MKSKKMQLLLVLTFVAALVVGCKPVAPVTETAAPIEMTQAALFAQATLTRVALENEVIKYLTQQALPTNTQVPEVVPPTATNTAIPPTATNTAIPPTATNTAIPPTATHTAVPPTATKTSVPPTTAPIPPAVRISFETGATNASVMGTVAAYNVQRYVFWAAEDQLIDVSLTSGQDAYITIKSKSGTVLLGAAAEQQFYRGYLPASGDYYIDIHAGGENVNFGLYLMIPQRLSFAVGTYGMTFDDDVPAGGVHNYMVYAFSGQTLTVSVVPAGEVALSIWGKDGTVLMSAMGEGNTFEGELPSTQDWIINVRAIPGTGTQDYTFSIDIR